MGRFGRVVSALVVSAKFWGESIRPILVGRFGRESFRPWIVLAQFVCLWGRGRGDGTLNFSAYVDFDPASTAYPLKISQINICNFMTAKKIPILYLALNV